MPPPVPDETASGPGRTLAAEGSGDGLAPSGGATDLLHPVVRESLASEPPPGPEAAGKAAVRAHCEGTRRQAG